MGFPRDTGCVFQPTPVAKAETSPVTGSTIFRTHYRAFLCSPKEPMTRLSALEHISLIFVTSGRNVRNLPLDMVIMLW